MCAQEEGVTHTATPLGGDDLGTSEEAPVAVGQSRTKDLCEKHKPVVEVIAQAGITQIREELSPATRTNNIYEGSSGIFTTIATAF